MRGYMVLIFIITIISLLRYIDNKIKAWDQAQIQQLKDAQLTDLSSYVEQVEAMYNELRSFRHDYRNILISLNESVQTQDTTIIKETYEQILNDEGLKLQDEHHSLAKLNLLKTLPVKSVFSSHVIKAWESGIAVNLEIQQTIADENIDTLDYVRIVAILLDNAIEAALESTQPLMNIVYLKNEETNDVQLIIENSIVEKEINLHRIFEKGYSTKGQKRGLGLNTVQTILKSSHQVSLHTEYNRQLFRQTLIIKGETQ
ncbi:GHKL domain-containing protein [Enterococcus sp. AZ194]|uniref:GHKL domain-containing protein n=1 Tax=Enterococcus sp. AZ194 TaxID=2774629 RepID=UPI003F683041